jgi:predicted nucleotidyltransferase
MEIATADNPLAPNTVRLADILGPMRGPILAAARNRGVVRIRVFGSVARDEAEVSSDVDFLVDMEPGRSLFDLGGLLMDLQELLGVPVDVVTEKGLRERIRARVLRDAISL